MNFPANMQHSFALNDCCDCVPANVPRFVPLIAAFLSTFADGCANSIQRATESSTDRETISLIHIFGSLADATDDAALTTGDGQ